ncbi:SGNH/GDSL hydrolase family protein [Nonomuraea sp. NPDC050556]|uniref:SGNH/GDSL hydrolase family protein n=1 Tax=Nonomuraea sp. NPDC050556 TaxID=3364369 RepID=UPI0037ABCE98
MVAVILALIPVGGLGALIYVAFRRPPANPPIGPGAHTVMVGFGDSLTHATLSTDWIGALRDRLGPDGYAFFNAGQNGHTSADLLRRLDDVVSRHPDAVTIWVGTNDARNNVPVTEFRANLEAIVDGLRTRTTARLALMSSPPLGEDLDGEMNQRLAPYVAATEEVARRAALTYLPAHERLAEHAGKYGKAPRYAFGFGLAMRAAVQRYVLRRSFDAIAAGNGLTVLTDHVHLSDRAGATVADLVTGWLTRTHAAGPRQR